MMTKNQLNEREQLEILTIEQLVPSNHLVRKLDAAIVSRACLSIPFVYNLNPSLRQGHTFMTGNFHSPKLGLQSNDFFS